MFKLLRRQYKAKRQAAEQDLSTARAVEGSLLAKLEELEAHYEGCVVERCIWLGFG